MINKIYNYPDLERIEKNGLRFYLDSLNNPVPSVTTVLSETSEKSFDLKKWKLKVGEVEAERIKNEATTIGTAVHEALEQYLYGKDWNNFNSSKEHQIAARITKKFIESGLDGIEEVWGLESGLVLDGLYAGTADCIGIFEGESSIIDFKTAKQIKKKEWITDYFLQGVAYANAHNVMFNTDIKNVVILMVDRELIFKKFTISLIEFQHFTSIWKKKLIAFDRKIDHD